MLEKINLVYFKIEYEYGELIKKSNPILSRVVSFALPIIGFVGVIIDIFNMLEHSGRALIYSLVKKQSPLKYFSTTSNIYVGLAEFLRHLIAFVFGFTGIIFPAWACVHCIPPDQKHLEELQANPPDASSKTDYLSKKNAAELYAMLHITSQLL